MTGRLGNIANVVHGAGLTIGIVIGLSSSFIRRLR
jgi:hypothetical protein